MVGNSTVRRCVIVALLLGGIAALSYGRSADGDVKPKGAGKGVVPAAPDFPISLPAGASGAGGGALHRTVPPGVFVGRVMALTRTLQCPRCSGTGTKVTRHRDLHRGAGGSHHARDPRRLRRLPGHGLQFEYLARESGVGQRDSVTRGSTDPDAPTTAKLLDKARSGPWSAWGVPGHWWNE